MHTIQTAIVFSLSFLVVCGMISLDPIMYERTHKMAELSVDCQDENNSKKSIFRVLKKENDLYEWRIENGCPEKAYRLGKGASDSLRIVLG